MTPEQAAVLGRIGANIVRLRRKARLSQEALADEAGLDRAYMGRVERGVGNVSVLTLQKIADALGVSLARLLR